MKNINQLLAILVFMPFFLYGQSDELPSAYLRTHSLVSHVSNIGLAKTPHANDNINFPHDSTVRFLSHATTGMWLAAEAEDGELKAAYSLFPSNHFYEYTPGVIDRTTGDIMIDLPFFNRIWKIEIHQIEQLEKDFENNNLNINRIPSDILEWPANGNPHISEVNIDYDLAPFFDRNGDTIYDPMQGDFPIALEERPNFTPSEFTFNVIVESNSVTTFTSPLKVEVQQIAYVINCDESILSDAVNYRWKITNHSSEEYKKLHIGIFDAQDNGCPQFSRVGTHIPSNSTYFYNRRKSDNGCPLEIENEVNEFSIVEANVSHTHQLQTSMPWHNQDLAIQTLIHPINYFKSKWQDHTPLTYGHHGYNPISTDSVDYIFPDFIGSDGWHPESFVINKLIQPTLISGYAENEFNVNESINFDFSKFIYKAPSENASDLFEKYEEKINDFKTELNKALNGETNCQAIESICSENCVWPTDANNDGIVNNTDYIYVSRFLKDEYSDSKTRTRTDNQWYSHNSENWNQELLNIDAKHGDTDGNGEINKNDFDNIVYHFGKTNHTYTPTPDNKITHDDPHGFGFIPAVITKDMSNPDELTNTELVFITLGDSDGVLEEEICGLSFELRSDTRANYTIINFHNNSPSITTTIRDHNNVVEKYSKIDPIGTKVLYTNTDKSYINNIGNLIFFSIRVDENFYTDNEDGRDTINIDLYNLTAITKSGELIDIGIRENFEFTLTNVPLSPPVSTNEVLTKKLSIYPNPAEENLFLDLEDDDNFTITIYNTCGQTIIQSINTNKKEINISNLKPGLYYIEVTSKHKTLVNTFVKR